MRDISTKTDYVGDKLYAGAFNSLMVELEELAKTAGFTLDAEVGPDSDLEMFSKSVVIYALTSQYFVDGGAANAYVLTRSGDVKPISSYTNGMIVCFKASDSNTGASTINIDGVGVKDLIFSDGTALTSGAILADHYVIARYDSSIDDFEIVYSDTTTGETTVADQLNLDSTPDTNQTANGIRSTKTVDSNGTGFAAALFLSADGNYDEADATDSSLMPCTALALESGTGPKTILKQGYIRDDSWNWTPGSILYMSTTTGAMSHTAPSGANEIVQVVGIAETATIVYFDPSFDTAEIAP